MIRPKDMSMVRIIVPYKRAKNVINSLYNLKMLHIVDFKKSEESFFDIGAPFKEATIYSRHLVDLRSMISRLDISGKPKLIRDVHQANKKFFQINRSFKNIVNKLDGLKSEETELLNEANNPLKYLNIVKTEVPEFKYLICFAGTVKSPIEKKLQTITTQYIIKQIKLEKRIAFILFVKRDFEEKIKSILNESGFTEHQLPKFKKDVIEKRLSEIRKETQELENHLKNLGQINSQFLTDYEFTLTQLNEKAEVPLKFASSKNTFIVTGWVPTNQKEKLKQKLNEVTKEKIHVEFLRGSNPPTKLENPKSVKSFEFFLNLYSLPKYYEIDPTLIMFFTFPLFFGFMLGDVGYGLITLVTTLLLERTLSIEIKPLLRIITISSIATIIFGFVFGEFFGHEFIHPLLNRVRDIESMMLVAVAVGLIHINLGLILGLLNELKHHSFFESVLRKGSWIVLQISVAMLWFGYSQSNQIIQITGGGLFVASMTMMIKGEGFLRIVEIPSIFSNILSYIRLYAIGLSSVALASIINELAFEFFATGGISIIFGISILIIGHFLNLLLGLLGPFLHSLRLHYVEFFQKFYEGGGYKYNPFGTTKIGG